jgi:hypothetical protein
VSGARDPRAGRRSGTVSRAGVLAGRRRALYHPPGRHHARPDDGRPQRRDVSHPGDRPARAGDALAASQGRGGALARDGGARGEDVRGDRAGRRRRFRPRSTNSCSPGSCAASPFGSPRR